MNLVIAETMLRAYASLESMAEQIDRLVYRRAVLTHSLKSDCVCLGAERQVEEIIKLMNKKNALINLKITTDEILSALGDESREILVARYVTKEDRDAVTGRLGLSVRTYFRRLEKAMKTFACECCARGCDEKWFAENYFDQSWLKNLYRAVFDKKFDGAKKAAAAALSE